MHSTEQQGRLELLVSAVNIINIVAARQLANVPVWVKTTDKLTVYGCFVTFISTKARHCTYYSACILFVDVELWLTVLRHYWQCCICSYCHNIISLGSPPVFLECTSYTCFRQLYRLVPVLSTPVQQCVVHLLNTWYWYDGFCETVIYYTACSPIN